MNQILQGDCIEVLKKLEENSVDAIVTDPPYELGFMGREWDKSGIAYQKGLWEEVLRVLKPGGHLLSFGGSRTYHRMACAIEDAGFEIRDQIMWVYGSGFPKSLNIGKAVDKIQGNDREVIGKIQQPGSTNKRIAMGNGWQEEPDLTKGNSEWEGWGTALKPSHEPIVLARKPLSEKTVAENVLKWGTGGLNIDGCRVEAEESDRFGGGLTSESSSFTTSAHKKGTGFIQSNQGRFPANLIHDGSDEVVEMFPNTKSTPHPHKHNIDKEKIYGGGKGLGIPYGFSNYSDEGSAARFFYTAKASKSERNMGLEGFEEKTTDDGREVVSDRPHQRGATLRANHHPTVKPLSLMRYLCKLITLPKGIVLDPFCGSGSTLIAAKMEGFNYIGIEKEEEYIKIAQARIKAVPESLF